MTNEWSTTKIKDFCEFKYGKNLPADKRVEGQYPVYGSSAIASYHKDYLIEGPGLIIGRKGTVGKVQLSKCNFFPIDTTYYVDKSCTDENIYFLYYFFQLCGFEEMNSDAAVPGLNRNAAINLKVKLPSRQVQNKIAALLLAYDDLIENNLKRLKMLEEMVQVTYEEWFLRMKFPGHKNSVFNDETELPEGWGKKSLRELTSYINRGVAPKYVEGKGVFVINQKCIREHRVNFSDSRLTSTKQKITDEKILQPLDILVNSTGTGTLGRVAQLFTTESKSTVDTHVTIVRASQDVCPYWLGRSLEALEPFIVNLGKGATNQQELGRHDLADIVKLNLPPQVLMEKYSEVAKPIYHTITNLLEQNIKLKDARDILLPRLITGMIDIEQVELPEIMLKRIENGQKTKMSS